MSGKKFDFQTQIEIGNQGEIWLKANYHQQLQKVDKLSPVGDFLRADGKIIEIKTDTYPIDRTPNFFFEQYSSLDAKSLGGPWRAYEKGADIFLYFYVSSGVYYEFEDLYNLVRRTDEIIKTKKLRPIYIRNRGWTTTGFKIERQWVSDLCVERRPEHTTDIRN
jgi:hypothetical protein